MNQCDVSSYEMEILRTRLTKLSEASVRIYETLEFNTVLQVVLDSARELTDARYSFLTVLDESGALEDVVASGLSEEEITMLRTIPGGRYFYRYFESLTEPLRVGDFQSHARDNGLPEFRPPMEISDAMSFLGAPIRHLGQPIGRIYLAEKREGRKFSLEDEETLVMFASQAALVISNARKYREEQRARSDLDALIETSPVTVLVFNAATGELVSYNGEAQRIARHLDEPGTSMTDVLKSSTIRRSDGHTMADESSRVSCCSRKLFDVQHSSTTFYRSWSSV